MLAAGEVEDRVSKAAWAAVPICNHGGSRLVNVRWHTKPFTSKITKDGLVLRLQPN